MRNVLSFINFRLEMEFSKHYIDERVPERVKNLKLVGFEGDADSAVHIDRSDAEQRLKYLINRLAVDKMEQLEVPAKTPERFYAICLGEIQMTREGKTLIPIMSTDDGTYSGSVYYAMAVNKRATTIVLYPKNMKEDKVIAKFHDNFRREE